jgi:hypothetical protein
MGGLEEESEGDMWGRRVCVVCWLFKKLPAGTALTSIFDLNLSQSVPNCD